MSEQEIKVILVKILERLDIQSAEMVAMEKRIRDDMQAMETRLENKIDAVEVRLDALEQKVESQIDAVNTRISELEITMTANFEIVHGKIDHIIRVQNWMSDKLTDHEDRILALEQQHKSNS